MIARSLLLVVAMSSTAMAAPKTKAAKAAFDVGVAAYTKNDWPAASAALEKSFGLEADPDTLFAWAQSERQRGDCAHALELFDKLLGFDLPAPNKAAVKERVDECKAIVAAQKPAEPGPRPAPVEPAPPVEAKSEPAPMPPSAEGRAWWKDPIGGALVGAGAIGLATGTYFLLSARAADRDAKAATNYFDFEAFTDRAESRGRIGVISTLAGAALVTGGIVWYATHGKKTESRLTTWVAPTGAGLVAHASF